MPEATRLRPEEFDGGRLGIARQLRGYRKSELAALVNLSPAAITGFEDGSMRPRPEVLGSLALALKVPKDYFSQRESPPRVSEHEFHFRRLRSSRKIDRARLLAQTVCLAELVGELEHYVGLPPVELPGEFALEPSVEDAVAAIDEVASALRARWQLGAGPISDVVRLLESKGAIVTRVRSGTSDIDAFSGWCRGRPYVMLSSDKDSADRSRFDAAHELGHLVLHPDPDPTNREHEVQAHLFASTFLMPAASIVRELPQGLDWPRYLELKGRWRVSLQALLRRARDVDRLTESQFRRAMTHMSARGWRVREPGDAGAIEEPVVLKTALARLERDRGIQLRDLANALRLGEHDVESLLAEPLTIAS